MNQGKKPNKEAVQQYIDFITDRLNWEWHYKDVDMMLCKHHIVPKKFGGVDDITNYVLLSAADHAIAHYLLYEAFGDRGDLQAKYSAMAATGMEFSPGKIREYYARRSDKIALKIKHQSKMKAIIAGTIDPKKPNM